MAAGTVLAAALLCVTPAAAQLQAPRPELMTGPPSPPAGNSPAVPMPTRSLAAPSPGALPSPAPSVAGLPQTPLAGPPHPRRHVAQSHGPRGDAAEDLNHVEMEHLRQTRPDIAPPAGSPAAAAVSPTAVSPRASRTASPADTLNRGELAGARADRSTDNDGYAPPLTVRP